MNNKKNIILIGVLAVIILGVIVSLFYYKRSNVEEIGPSTNTTSTAPIATGTEIAKPAPKPTAAAGLVQDVSKPSLTYAQAVKVYAASRIQFDESCQAIPTTISLKNGVTVMFDNRSRDARSFYLDGKKYSLPGYGFKLFQLTASKLPHNVNVDCGLNQNSGNINLQ